MNGSGASDSVTFTISPATGPVVSITPTEFTVTGGSGNQTLNIAVTQDAPNDFLSIGVTQNPYCAGACGTFGAISGVRGGGSYTVVYAPPSGVTNTVTGQQITVISTLPGSTPGLSFPTINAAQ